MDNLDFCFNFGYVLVIKQCQYVLLQLKLFDIFCINDLAREVFVCVCGGDGLVSTACFVLVFIIYNVQRKLISPSV